MAQLFLWLDMATHTVIYFLKLMWMFISLAFNVLLVYSTVQMEMSFIGKPCAVRVQLLHALHRQQHSASVLFHICQVCA